MGVILENNAHLRNGMKRFKVREFAQNCVRAEIFFWSGTDEPVMDRVNRAVNTGDL